MIFAEGVCFAGASIKVRQANGDGCLQRLQCMPIKAGCGFPTVASFTLQLYFWAQKALVYIASQQLYSLCPKWDDIIGQLVGTACHVHVTLSAHSDGLHQDW